MSNQLLDQLNDKINESSEQTKILVNIDNEIDTLKSRIINQIQDLLNVNEDVMYDPVTRKVQILGLQEYPRNSKLIKVQTFLKANDYEVQETGLTFTIHFIYE